MLPDLHGRGFRQEHGWIAEVTAVRTAAENQRERRPGQGRLTKEQIHGLMGAVGDFRTALRRADAATANAELYRRLRIRLTYDPGKQIVRAESELSPDDVGNGSVSEGRHLPDAYAVRLVGEWPTAW